MGATPSERHRITGPLKTWYDMHEALTHEVRGLADDAAALTPDTLAAFASRFWAFERELHNHSQVEDGIMFPAMAERGGSIDASLGEDHRREQLAVYTIGAALLHANGSWAQEACDALAEPVAQLRDELIGHLQAEEASALTQVDGLFDDDAQSALFRSIITSLPPDPQLQPWVAAALTPEHLELRLRNIARSMPLPALGGLMAQIHDGVDAATWAVVEDRVPDLAALASTSPSA